MSAAAKIVVMTAEEFTEALSRVAEASARRALELAQSRAHEEPSCRRWVAAGMPHDGVGTRRRFDLEACRAWLRDRPRVATNILTEGVTRKKTKAP